MGYILFSDGHAAEQATRIAVGVASYNRLYLLKRAIQSAVSQTYANLENLISDDGSSNPEVRTAIDEFVQSDARIRCIFHPVNQGSFFNFRAVLNEASSECFVWLVDDDYWCLEFLESPLMETMRTVATLTYGRADIVDNVASTQMPLHNNGPMSFWGASLARNMYLELVLAIESLVRVLRSYGTGTSCVEYPAVSA